MLKGAAVRVEGCTAAELAGRRQAGEVVELRCGLNWVYTVGGATSCGPFIVKSYVLCEKRRRKAMCEEAVCETCVFCVFPCPVQKLGHRVCIVEKLKLKGRNQVGDGCASLSARCSSPGFVLVVPIQSIAHLIN